MEYQQWHLELICDSLSLGVMLLTFAVKLCYLWWWNLTFFFFFFFCSFNCNELFVITNFLFKAALLTATRALAFFGVHIKRVKPLSNKPQAAGTLPLLNHKIGLSRYPQIQFIIHTNYTGVTPKRLNIVTSHILLCHLYETWVRWSAYTQFHQASETPIEKL